jgi:hypothetical protein
VARFGFGIGVRGGGDANDGKRWCYGHSRECLLHFRSFQHIHNAGQFSHLDFERQCRGDLLVTSSTPGYATKGTDRATMLGAVIGKAIGSLESD